MSGELVHTAFDYGKIDYDTKGKLIRLAAEINRQKVSHIQTAIQLGKELKGAHDLLCNHGNGTFSKWVVQECGISRTTSHKYMQVWKLLKDCHDVDNLDINAAYLLSSPDAPKEAFKKAEKLRKDGVKITIDAAKQLIDEANGKAIEAPKSKQAPVVEDATAGEEEEPESSPSPTEEAGEETESPPEPEPVPRAWGEGDELEDVQADLREFKRRCGELSKFARTILRCEGTEITRPYCGEYSLLTLSHPLLHVGRCVANDLPVGGTPKKPILFHEEKAASLAN